MKEIEQYRRRLAALRVEQTASRAARRSLEDRLRGLKEQVLARLTALRDRAVERGSRARKPRTEEGARALLKDVHDRVTGMLDNRDASSVVEEWSRINQEIDERLARLAQLEAKLARGAGEASTAARPVERPSGEGREAAGEDEGADDLYAAAGHREDRPGGEAREEVSDDLYAAVGAQTRKGERHDAYCPHCGKGVESGDRFCRRCGHHLSPKDQA